MNTEDIVAAYLGPERQSLGFLMADTLRLIRRASASFLEEHQLTLAQTRALLYVGRNQGIRQVELADLLDVQPITLARLIDQLAETGLVERRADPRDRRAFQLYLTPAAAPIVAIIGQRSAGFQQRALEGLTPEQVESLFFFLNQVRDNLSNMLTQDV